MKLRSNHIKRIYALAASSCLCTESLLILKSFWGLSAGTLTAAAEGTDAAMALPVLPGLENVRTDLLFSPAG